MTAPKKTSMITAFFIWLSGANLPLLRKCPVEISKYVNIGMVILLTGLFASLSAGYAMHMLFHDWAVAIPVAVLWALMIVMLDRYFVSSIKKTSKAWKQFLHALPRIALAFLIGFVISYPLELRIFQTSIEKQIATSALQKSKELASEGERFIDSTYNRRILFIQNELQAMETTKPLAVISLEADLAKARREYTGMKKGVDERNQRIDQLIQNIEQKGTVDESDQARIAELKNLKRIHEAPLQPVMARIKRIEISLDTEIKLYAERVRKERERSDKEINRISQEKDTVQSGMANRTRVLNSLLGTRDLPELIRSFSVLQRSDSVIRWASILISIVFILIETAPILVKLLNHAGPYDYLLELNHRTCEAYAKEKIDKSRLGASVRIEQMLTLEKFTREQEAEGQKEVIRMTQRAYLDAAKMVIEEWLKRQKEDIRQNIDKYISTIYQNN
jgi:hypothetical protein